MQHELAQVLLLINKAYDLSRMKKVKNAAVCIGKNEIALFERFIENGADYEIINIVVLFCLKANK